MDVMAATEYLALLNDLPAVSWLAYIIIGGIAGWIAGKIVKGGGVRHPAEHRHRRRRRIHRRMLLGWLHVDIQQGARWFTFFVSLLGAVILLWIVSLVRRRGSGMVQ